MNEKLKLIYLTGYALNVCSSKLLEEFKILGNNQEQFIDDFSKKIQCSKEDLICAQKITSNYPSSETHNYYATLESEIFYKYKETNRCNKLIKDINKCLETIHEGLEEKENKKNYLRKLTALGDYKFVEECKKLKDDRKIARKGNKKNSDEEIKNSKEIVYAKTREMKNMLYHNLYSENIEIDKEIVKFNFKNKYELAEYVHELTKDIKNDYKAGPELWNWLSLFYVDILDNGPGYDHIIYALQLNSRDSKIRHLVYAPYDIYKMYGERSKIFLTNDVNVKGDTNESGLQNRNYLTPQIIDFFIKAYFDEEKFILKKGFSASKVKKGSFRRAIELIKQINMQYVMHGMSEEDITELMCNVADEFEHIIGNN